MIKAIIFDLDGVISNTDKTRFEYLKVALKEKGIILPDSDYKKSVGKRTRIFLKEMFGDKLSDDEIETIYRERKKEFHENPGKFVVDQPFAKDCCRRMYETGLPLAIASSSLEKEIKLVLEIFKLLKYFQVIVGSDKIKNPKPHPETYLECAKSLGFSPQDCVAIEDSPVGVKSAKASDCRCIAVTYTHEKDELREADVIVESLAEVDEKMIKSL